MLRSASWPLAACILIAAGSSAEEPDGSRAQSRNSCPETFIVEPAVPIAGAGTCARFSGDADRECVSLYRAVLTGKLQRTAPDGMAGRWG